MNFLHTQAHIGPESCFLVRLSGQANVMLLDDCNFGKYRTGQRFNYRGGLAKRSPVRMTPPHHGNWHIVVDRGGYEGSIRAKVQVI